MPNAELAFADKHISLIVRSFSIEDGISKLFEALVTAVSRSPDLDLKAIVGRPAALRLHTGDVDHPYAVWSGICSHVEQISVEESGSSIYAVRIVPSLWRTTQRRNFRVFQHQNAVDVVNALLDEWGIAPTLRLDAKTLPVHEYRVQFGETDFSFVSRMLEEAGLSYIVEQANPRGAETRERGGESRQRADARELTEEEKRMPSMHLVLADRPGRSGKKHPRPVTYMGNTENVPPDRSWISKVRVGRGVRAGRFTIAGYDYRSSPDLRLLSEAKAGMRLEERYEQFTYEPKAFISEPPPERGTRRRPQPTRVNDSVGQAAALLGLERERSCQQVVAFHTNQIDLAPGSIVRLEGHPRAELCGENGLMVVSRRIEGDVDGEWITTVESVLSADPFRPQLITPKPRVMDLQSAIVVGPRGEEIYTDALGRVRVQFHWDRYGKRDENSSCWIRVSQAWAGSGYGTCHIPRVGHEVLVDFFEGDPDRPLVVGRAYNRGAQPPDVLPKNKTKSTWKSSTSPGGEGFSEISIDDIQGEELVYMRAQRNMKRQVVLDDETSVGGTMKTTIRKDEERKVVGNQNLEVDGDREVKVEGKHAIHSGSVLTQAGETTGVSVQDGKVILSNGSASIVLDGPHVYIDAAANLRLRAGAQASMFGQTISFDAGRELFLNSAEYLAPDVVPLPAGERRRQRRERERERPRRERRERRERDRRPRRPGREREAEFSGKDYLLGVVNRSLGTKVKLPKAVVLPPEIDEQLERYGRIGFKGERVAGHVLDADTYDRMRRRFARRIEGEQRRLQKMGNDVHRTFEKHRDHYGATTERLQSIAARERENLGKLGDDLGEIFSGERGGFIESCKALVDVAKEQGKNLGALRKDITTMIDREMTYFQRAKREWQAHANEFKGVANDLKELVNNPKDALIDIVVGDDKQMAEDIANLADEFGAGDDVRDFLGMDDPEAGRPRRERPRRPRDPGRGDRDRPRRPRDPDRGRDRGRDRRRGRPEHGASDERVGEQRRTSPERQRARPKGPGEERTDRRFQKAETVRDRRGARTPSCQADGIATDEQRVAARRTRSRCGGHVETRFARHDAERGRQRGRQRREPCAPVRWLWRPGAGEARRPGNQRLCEHGQTERAVVPSVSGRWTAHGRPRGGGQGAGCGADELGHGASSNERQVGDDRRSRRAWPAGVPRVHAPVWRLHGTLHPSGASCCGNRVGGQNDFNRCLDTSIPSSVSTSPAIGRTGASSRSPLQSRRARRAWPTSWSRAIG